jgi:hypothetical protein
MSADTGRLANVASPNESLAEHAAGGIAKVSVVQAGCGHECRHVIGGDSAVLCCVLVGEQASLRQQELTGVSSQRHADVTPACCLNDVEQG